MMDRPPGSTRPFYGEYAWAFDLLIDRPVRKECAVIVSWLIERGVLPGSMLLDAGCGTGRYAAELARRGYRVHGIDASPPLIDVARQSGSGAANLSFAIGDMLTLPPADDDAVLCRGVLNDLLEDDERQRALDRFADSLRPEGVLILDVREWEASAERKAREPLFRKRVATERGTLTFTSVTELDAEKRQLVTVEQHALEGGGGERSSEYRFVMRCWTREELDDGLARAGFGRVRYFGAYDAAVDAGATDRVVAVAQLATAPDG